MPQLCELLILQPFLVIFWQPHKYISQKLASDSHFGGARPVYKSQLDHKLHHKTQFFLFPLFSIFEEKILKIDDSKTAIF